MKTSQKIFLPLIMLVAFVCIVHGQAASPDAALAALTKAVNADPANPQVYFERGQEYLKQKKYALALADADKLISLVPATVKKGLAMAYTFRGTIFREQGKLTEALADFNKASSVFPYEGASIFRVEIQLEQGVEPDRTDVSTAITYTNQPKFYLARGDLFERMGGNKFSLSGVENYNKFALDDYENYIKYGGSKEIGLRRRIKVYCKVGDKPAALFEHDRLQTFLKKPNGPAPANPCG